MTPEKAKEILDLPMQQPNDAKAETVRQYLAKLLTKVVDEGECFSGKRPFGNSGWEHQLHFPLVQAGLVEGQIEDGYLEDHDDAKAHKLILDVIGQVFA